MSGRDTSGQKTIAGEVFFPDSAQAGVDDSASAVRGATICSSRNGRVYKSELSGKEFCEAPDTSLFPVMGTDSGSFMWIWRQLELIAKRQAPRIGFKTKGSIVLLELADIVAVQAEGNYVSLRHPMHSYLVRESILSMAEKLKPYGFIRIHRSVIVNISAVQTIQPLTTGEYRLHLRGGKEYLVTRTYKHKLRDLAELWVGPERLCG